jgi:parallel beta-helix repeat protein
MDDEIGATRTFFLDDIELTTAAIYVPDDYPTIQDAVNVASDGDTIIVRDGTYIENVKVYKRLTIQSENGCDNCIVQGGNSNDHVFEVRENYVNIRGFTVEGANGTVGSAGIYLGGVGHCHISNNNASNNDCGILLDDSSSNTLTNNIANNNNFHGIYLYDSSNNSLSTNIAYNNDDTGICLDSSKKNILTKNTVYNNRWNGICLHDSSNNSLMNNIANNTHNGIILDESSSNTLTHNTAYNNGDTGILLVYSSNNMLTNNTVDNNTYNGICLDNSSNNTLMNNIANNNLEGIYLHNSSDNTLTGNIANSNNYIGIHLHDSSDNTLTCNIANSNNWGIDLYTSCDNALKDNTMSGNGYNFAVSGWFFSHFIQDIDTSNEVNGKPIYYWVDQQDKQISNDAGYVGIVNSTNITVKDLTLTNNGQGVLFAYTSNSKIENVTALNNCDGIWLYDSSYNTLTNNTMSGNCYNFGVKGCFNHFIQNIDRSNKVNGKPIYYWVDQQDKQIPNDAGYVGIVNSTNITVKDLTLTNNGQGVLFAYTSNSRIENVTASENYYGIYLEDSSSNTLSKNSNNNNWIFGILLQYSSDNVIVNNCVSNNRERGIHLYNSINNLIYHNNHINNGNQAYDNTDTNLWNSSYPTGGNYWNDYNGSDAYCGPDQNLPGSDGVGDTPYNISGDAGAQDRYPFLNESGWLTGLTTITISPSTK